MEKSLLIDPQKCTSCLQCEMACSFEKTGRFNPARSRIKIFEIDHGAISIPYTCTQCAEAWCLHSCPVQALNRNPETNAVEVSEADCVGCKVCTIACPFGTVNYDPESQKVIKCDLCGGDPACAKACPTGAITFVDSASTGYERMREHAISGLPKPEQQSG
ncbi:4Fe-4S dicluster domain-containing protein [Pseudohalocynthiibacter sp. F2068]|jgi:anaerobic carbon-monoxide dehydrogenase iron sulfur subunit|uniref:4Fe-4S dicluster domain-containing protein n=1 Tax=Pseudohalocynthiibacter sp. F2068 TaxID=2926418 RepID=UPI001FF24685|nr:4Fe-4S dicluster domain-containing protein [Pseudohalocynthiibacter sp. F2068]MCK0104427.1 4Fe-4S dicluster domain-containing protein [Pseudohalocynthiibacter sp. F2068]